MPRSGRPINGLLVPGECASCALCNELLLICSGAHTAYECFTGTLFTAPWPCSLFGHNLTPILQFCLSVWSDLLSLCLCRMNPSCRHKQNRLRTATTASAALSMTVDEWCRTISWPFDSVPQIWSVAACSTYCCPFLFLSLIISKSKAKVRTTPTIRAVIK